MTTAMELAPVTGILAACLALGVTRATFYRARQPMQMLWPRRARERSPLALPAM